MPWIEFEGLEELIKKAETVANSSTIEKANKNILKRAGKLVHGEAKKITHRSENPMKSGRKGSRTGQHAADNIPLSGVKNKNGSLYIVVGWEKDDNSPFFYMKFEEWGTSQRPPHASLRKSLETYKSELNNIAQEEYNNLIKNLE